jgi:hypothetical protein
MFHLQKNVLTEQLFSQGGVLSSVVSKCRASSSHGSGFPYPQCNSLPTT